MTTLVRIGLIQLRSFNKWKRGASPKRKKVEKLSTKIDFYFEIMLKLIYTFLI